MKASTPLIPKNPDAGLQVLLLGRVSTPHQDIANIEAGYDYAKRHLQHYYQGPIHVKQLGEQGSGMLTERRTIAEAAEEIGTGQWDAVLMEDVSKPYRNPRWIYAFVQDAVDMGCRVIAPGDNLDTADENWEVTLGAAALRHGLHIPDTRRRVRRTATHSFHGGGMATKYRFGYRKLTKEEANSGQFGPKGLRLAKLPECTATIQEMRRRRLAGATRNAIADWLDAEGISPGPYVKDSKWTGKLVDELLRDPILSGTRIFRATIYEPVFKTGKHRRRKNASPETEHYPELAHLTPEEQQELITHLDREAAKRRGKTGPQHPLHNRPRQRSIWPGQSARCAACGHRMYRSGKFLKCRNALANGARSCWNHTQVDYVVLRNKVLPWVLEVLDRHPNFRAHVVEAAWQEFERSRRRRHQSVTAVDERLVELEKRAARLAKAIALGGQLEALVTELSEVQQALQSTRQEKERLLAQVDEEEGFLTREEVAARLDEAAMKLAETSLDFADLLRRLLPEFVIQPVQALDRPQIRPRGEITLRLDAWCQGVEPPPPVSVSLDLFDPPEHIKHVAACVAARRARPEATLQELANDLGIGKMTVYRALAYSQLMEQAGTTDLYREIHERPQHASRWTKRTNGDRHESA